MTNPERSPLTIRTKAVADPHRAFPRDVYIGARWLKRDITTANHWQFMGCLAWLLEYGYRVPPVPRDLAVRMRTREFVRLLEHPRADMRAWVMLNLTPRLARGRASKRLARRNPRSP